MPIHATMKIALTTRAALRELQHTQGARFPAGSLKHLPANSLLYSKQTRASYSTFCRAPGSLLYTKTANAEQAKLARGLRVPTPAEA